MKGQFVVLLVTSLQIGVSFCHVALTYPIPRRVNYDFLDNIRTEGPCGGQEKGAPLSEIRAGYNFTVTWHLGYPHRGGYKIELMDANDNIVHKLLPTTDGQEFTGEDDTTATSAVVQIPADFTCDNCTLRLVRQALEWGDNYLFWTCSDIKVISTPSEFCSNKGTYSNGACKCDKLYYGNRCQYWDDCEQDSDCSNGGECFDTHAVSSPRKYCFCAPGYFGQTCQKVSSVKSLESVSLENHRRHTMGDNFVLYTKILNDEIEMVVKARSSSWVGIGWKPTGALNCKSIDKDPKPEGESTAEPESTPEAKTEPQTTLKPKAASESNSTIEPEPAAEDTDSHNATTSTTGTIEIISDKNYLASQGLDASLVTYQCVPGSGGKSVPEPESTPEGYSKSVPETTPEGYSKAEPQTTPEGYNKDKDHPNAEAETTAEPESTGATHPMDCTDMVIMAARGGKSRIYDAYSRDRSTPKADTYFGAENSLTAAIGEEKNGETTILFRRKLKAQDEFDHEIKDSLMTVIWAYGQEHLNYNHAPQTGLELCTVKDIFFYRKDVLMYHGHKGQRGTASINFITDDSDVDAKTFKVSDDTFVEWKYDSEADSVIFTLNAKLEIGGWMALGISDNRNMAETDVKHVGIASDGTSIPTDRYTGDYRQPALDASDSENIVSTWVDGEAQAIITIPVTDTVDSDDISVDVCRHLIIATGNGFTQTTYSKHTTTPVVSEEKLCFATERASSTVLKYSSLTMIFSAVLAIIFTH